MKSDLNNVTQYYFTGLSEGCDGGREDLKQKEKPGLLWSGNELLGFAQLC